MHGLGVSQKLGQSLYTEFGTPSLWLFSFQDYLLTSESLWSPRSLFSWFFKPERLLTAYCSFTGSLYLAQTGPCPHTENLENDQLIPYPSPFLQLPSPLKISPASGCSPVSSVPHDLFRVQSCYPHSVLNGITYNSFFYYQLPSNNKDFLCCLNEALNDTILCHSSMPL